VPPINLRTRLTLRTAFAFPLQSREARKEILVGGALLFVPFIGWLLNMGHRIAIVHAMQNGRAPWPAWHSWRRLCYHGLVTWLGMVYYYLPSAALLVIYAKTGELFAALASLVLFVLATLAIPGYMTHYCQHFDPAEIFNPFKALRRSIEGGRAYWHAWSIAIAALCLSLLGLLALGIGFLFTSVWFWQVAGYSFANAFSNRYQLTANSDA